MINAKEKWFSIPEEIRVELLHNVWCSNCIDAVEIVDYLIIGDDQGVILQGKCGTCSHDVARFIE